LHITFKASCEVVDPHGEIRFALKTLAGSIGESTAPARKRCNDAFLCDRRSEPFYRACRSWPSCSASGAVLEVKEDDATDILPAADFFRQPTFAGRSNRMQYIRST